MSYEERSGGSDNVIESATQSGANSIGNQDVRGTLNKESLGMYIQNNGPNDNGQYIDSSSLSLFLESYQPIKHQTNWDSGLTSFENTGDETFQNFGANNYLGYNNKVTDIQIIDDLAFISYGNYTDINKVVTKLSNQFLTIPYLETQFTDYDSVEVSYVPLTGWGYLQNLSTYLLRNNDKPDFISGGRININDPKAPMDLTNLFVVLKYTGTHVLSKSYMPNFASDLFSHLAGRNQVFSYSSNTTIPAGKFNDETAVAPYYDDEFGTHYVFQNSLCLNPGFSSILPRSDNYTESYSNLYLFDSIAATLDLACQVSLVKYNPVPYCGKVDIFERKNGRITSFTSDGYVLSTAHNLQNGDIIRISSVLNEDLNGIKFVQVLDSNTFILYNNKDFTERTYRGTYKTTGATWTAIGNVYAVESDLWAHKTTITSPGGRNRYSPSNSGATVAVEFSNPDILPIEINGVTTYEELFEADYDIDLDNASLPPLTIADRVGEIETNRLIFTNEGIIPERLYETTLDNWKLSEDAYVNNFRFGCSIDVKKYNNTYYLLAGERGPQTGLHLDYLNLPVVPLNGRAYLIELTQDESGDITASLNDELYANLASDVAEPLDSASADYTLIEDGGTYASQIYNNTIFNVFSSAASDENYPRTIEFEEGFEYWYGAMLMHIKDMENGGLKTIPGFEPWIYTTRLKESASYIPSLNPYTADTSNTIEIPRFLKYDYSINYNLVELSGEYSDLIASDSIQSELPMSYYPYTDSFGKSVALDIIDGNFYVFCSSKNKPHVYRPEEGDEDVEITTGPTAYSGPSNVLNSTSCGYIHVFKNGVFLQRIYEDGEVTGSQSYLPQYFRSENFAKTMVAENGELIFGFPKPMELAKTAVGAPNDVSKIIIYENSSDTYVKTKEILNRNNQDISVTNTYHCTHPDHKDVVLSNKVSLMSPTYLLTTSPPTNYRFPYYYPSDNFGHKFKYHNGILLVNAYDLYNEFGVAHPSNGTVTSATTYFDYALLYSEYIQIYERDENDQFVYGGKFSASFSGDDEQYSYEDILEPTLYKSLRELGNYNYSNTIDNSKTWDISLSGRYDILDDRIVLKDPLGYAIFQRTASEKLNRKFQCIFNKSVVIDDWFDELDKGRAGTGRLVYTNPVMGIGLTSSSATNDIRDGKLHKTYSSSYEILSIDNFYPTSNVFTNISSNLDVHDYEFLPLYIQADEPNNSGPDLDIFMKTRENASGTLDLFIKGNEPKTMTLIITATTDLDDDMPLFLNRTDFGYIPLYLKTTDPDLYDDALNLYALGKDGNETSDNDLNLMIKGFVIANTYPYEDDTTLVIIGPDKVDVTAGVPLFISKYVYEFESDEDTDLDISIYGATTEIDTGTEYANYTNLFLRNFVEYDDNMPLMTFNKGAIADQELMVYNTQSIEPHDDSLDLYIASYEAVSTLPFHLEVRDLEEYTDSVDLTVYGSVETITPDAETFDLVITGTEYTYSEGTADLIMVGPTSSDISNNAPLFINNFESTESDELDLFLYGATTEVDFGSLSSGTLGVFIRSANLFRDIEYLTLDDDILTLEDESLILFAGLEGAPLFICNKGIGGGDITAETLNLHVANSQIIDDVNLVINSTYTDDDSVDLYMSEGVGILETDLNVFIRGYKE